MYFTSGMRVEIPDAEWRIRYVDRASDGGHLLGCEGLSELVRGRSARFLTKLEGDIRILDPRETVLTDDASSGFQASLLYLETAFRKTSVAGDRVFLGHRAALIGCRSSSTPRCRRCASRARAS